MATEERNYWKQGASFEATCTIPVSPSLPNLVGVTIASSVRCIDNEVYDLDVVIPDTSKGVFTVSLIDTTAWAIGIAEWDIKLVKAGKVMYTDTIELDVERRVTP